MKLKIFKNVNYVGWIVIILAFVFIYFWYFFVYIPQKETKLDQKAFRILKEYGSNMFDKNNYYENHFKNYGLYYSIKYLKKEKLISETKIALDNEEKMEFADIKSVIDGLLPYVESDMVKHDKFVFVSSEKNTLFLNFPSKDTSVTSVNTMKKFYSSTSKFKLDSLQKITFLNRVPIDKFMEGLKFDELFENIILINDEIVCYNSNLDKLVDITNPDILRDTINKLQGGIHMEVNIGGKNKHIMILRIDFKGNPFYLAGLIKDVDYISKTRTINSQLFIYIASILLLVLIGMPILKIIFIDPNERLKAIDSVGSGISMLFGIGLIMIITISLLKNQVADRTEQIKRIQQISSTLCSNVTTDIDSIKALYSDILSDNDSVKVLKSRIIPIVAEIKNLDTTAYNPLIKYVKPQNVSKIDLILKSNHIPRNDSVKNHISLSIIENYVDSSKLSNMIAIHFESIDKFKKIGTLKSPFPLNEIILIDSIGDIQKAFSTTPFSDVVKFDLRGREYFKNAYNINNSWPSTDALNFYIESIKSYNTGEFETAISFHTTGFYSSNVMAITSKIPSLYDQILPKDIEFVIIDKTGKVLYHSKTNKNLHENFIQECESDIRLLNAIDSRVADNIQINYDEKKWMARIVNIKDTPLYHITLLDLNRSGNLNARIFLFTFYVFIVSFIFSVISLLIMSIFARLKSDSLKKSWLFSWIIFQPAKYKFYKNLTFILAIIIALQFLGIFIIDKPTTSLFYQLLFILYILLISHYYIIGEKIVLSNFFTKKYFPAILISLAPVLLIIIFLAKLGLLVQLVIHLLFLYLLTKLFSYIFRLRPTDNSKNLFDQSFEIKNKRTYLAFLFLWLASLSAVPVFHYYFSIKKQEEHIRHQEQFLNIAHDNLKLSDNGFRTAEWFKRIQGNGIDFMKISFVEVDEDFNSIDTRYDEKAAYKDHIYNSLPDLSTTDYNRSELFKEENYANEWFINDTLYFRKGKQKEAISVSYSKEKSQFLSFWYVLLIIFTFTLIAISVWVLLKYLAKVLLNLNQEKPAPSSSSWFGILENPEKKRVRLNSLNGECFLTESMRFINMQNTDIKEIEPISISKIIALSSKSKSLILKSNSIIWITGLKQIIHEIDKHKKIISFLTKLNRNHENRIIVDLSFDIDLIDEFYDDYITANDLTTKELAQIYLLRKKWRPLFEDYYEYNGFASQNYEHVNDLSDEKSNSEYACRINWKSKNDQSYFSNILSNLTSSEKIVLYDLADDGLLNLKNKDIIKKLILKRLIIPYPNPAFFSDEFRDFVRENVKSDEIKAIETKLGLSGRWHNARYLILMIIIPITAFIIISQGISVENVIGIFAGGLTVIAGLMRLLDSNIFKQSN